MAEELTFARRASGLTRGLSMFDAFGMGLLLTMPMLDIWQMIYLGYGLFPGGSMVIALIIAIIVVGFASPLVWGMLAGTMPRSGGEYVFNSRILHPAIALGASFAAIAAGIYWNFFFTGLLGVPLLQLLGTQLGWDGFATWVATSTGTFTVGAIMVVIAFLVIAFGMKIYKAVQTPMVVVALAGTVVLAIVLTFASKADFVAYWNELAAKYGSVEYSGFVAAVGEGYGAPVPSTWNWSDTIGMTSGVFILFIYNYVIAYVGGEVKRPDKSLLGANVLTVAVSGILGLWTVVALIHVVGEQFLRAAGINELFGGVEGYTMPYSTSYMLLSWIASKGNGFVAVAAFLGFFAVLFLAFSITFMAQSRALFAWGMDRMGPKWFTDVNSRFGVLMKNYILVFAITLVGAAAYILWFTSTLTGLAATGLQMVSVFGITGISAILLPYRKKMRDVWDASPYRTWSIAGIPLLTVAGAVYAAWMAMMVYFAFIDPRSRDVTGKNMITFAVLWAIGIAWYFFWRQYNKARSDIDVSVSYGQLPPD